MSSINQWRKLKVSNKWTKHKTFTRSRRIKSVEGEVERTYKKTARDCWGVGEEELSFKIKE